MEELINIHMVEVYLLQKGYMDSCHLYWSGPVSVEDLVTLEPKIKKHMAIL